MGGSSTKSEISVIESLETAIRWIRHETGVIIMTVMMIMMTSPEPISNLHMPNLKNWARTLREGGSSNRTQAGLIMQISSSSPRSTMTATTESPQLQDAVGGLFSPSWPTSSNDFGFESLLFPLPQDAE